MDQKNISLLVPCFGNYYKFLPELIASIEKQTVKPLEVLFDSTPNQAAARNKMAKLAQGEYICFLDVDDTLHPEFIEKTVGFDEIVSTEMQEFGDRNNYIIAQKDFSLKDFLIGNRINVSAVIKKEWFDKVGGFDESPIVSGYCDWDLWIRMIEAGYKVKIIREPLFNYRIHKNSITSLTDSEKHKIQTEYIKKKYENLYSDSSIFSNR